MPQLVRSTLYNTHKYGLWGVTLITALSIFIAVLDNDHTGFPVGNIRLVFWLALLFINFKLLEKIDRRISATLFIFSCYASFFLYPFIPLETNYSEDLFLLPSLLIVFCVLPYLVYDLENEMVWVIIWQVILLTTFFLAINQSISNMDPVRNEGLIIVFTDYTMLAAAYFACWIFVQIMFYKYLQNIGFQSKRIIEVNLNLEETVSQIGDQSKELDEQSEELRKLQEEISKLNNELENKVLQRTAELEIQTNALNKYGFVNSNLVRGPIEYVIDNAIVDLEHENLDIESLKSVMQDLDAITVAISDVLNLKNIEGIKEVEKMIKEKYGLND